MKSEKVSFPVQAILFDMDGTLIDSSKACARIWGRWAAHYGLNTEEVIHQSHGRRPEDTARSILGDNADIQAAVALFTQEEAKETDVTTIAGAKALLDKIPQGKWAIVTSSTENIAKERLQYCNLPLPKSLITAEKVSEGKPHPEGYLKAAEELGVDIQHCVVIEDAPGGIEAGHRAGAKVIVLTTTYPVSAFNDEFVIGNLEAIEFNLYENGEMSLSFIPIN
ncbi:HAD-IA family hydrolase [Avibacterium sp. 20-15]|uniref:HAD-IA family hydrolase n=1 Tax=unclassified Avibacterium TaxID=2685287 RepID=UPI00202764C0|nr:MULTISPECIES: HAD-IA family hydrolase [unclassified Avibacterium]MCW9734107.1 HAD-IA family hydrolase [Avibacterium sp. 20-15]URL03753.1 HAD-IA family hydrolase [Avibacterium sp. 20-132]